MGDFRDHGLMLYLGKPAYLGFIKLQADKSLGRSYAGQLAFTEGLFKLGYLAKDDYDLLAKRYSQGLVDKEAEKKPQSLADVQKLVATQKLEADFSNVLRQWQTMNVKSQQYWQKKAEANKGKVLNAQLVLDLAQGAVHA